MRRVRGLYDAGVYGQHKMCMLGARVDTAARKVYRNLATNIPTRARGPEENRAHKLFV